MQPLSFYSFKSPTDFYQYFEKRNELILETNTALKIQNISSLLKEKSINQAELSVKDHLAWIILNRITLPLGCGIEILQEKYTTSSLQDNDCLWVTSPLNIHLVKSSYIHTNVKDLCYRMFACSKANITIPSENRVNIHDIKNKNEKINLSLLKEIFLEKAPPCFVLKCQLGDERKLNAVYRSHSALTISSSEEIKFSLSYKFTFESFRRWLDTRTKFTILPGQELSIELSQPPLGEFQNIKSVEDQGQFIFDQISHPVKRKITCVGNYEIKLKDNSLIFYNNKKNFILSMGGSSLKNSLTKIFYKDIFNHLLMTNKQIELKKGERLIIKNIEMEKIFNNDPQLNLFSVPQIILNQILSNNFEVNWEGLLNYKIKATSFEIFSSSESLTIYAVPPAIIFNLNSLDMDWLKQYGSTFFTSPHQICFILNTNSKVFWEGSLKCFIPCKVENKQADGKSYWDELTLSIKSESPLKLAYIARSGSMSVYSSSGMEVTCLVAENVY